MPELTVYAVNVSKRLALMTDGTICEVTNLFDGAGDDTEDPTAAASCVVKHTEDSWFACKLSEFDRVTLQ